eukprot:5197653-Amphidinium_carterae.1
MSTVAVEANLNVSNSLSVFCHQSWSPQEFLSGYPCMANSHRSMEMLAWQQDTLARASATLDRP